MNKKFRKALALLIAAILIAGLAACGPSNAPVNNAQTGPAENTAPGQSNTAPEQGNTAPEQGNTANTAQPAEPQQPEENYTLVSSLGELMEKAVSGARLKLKSGTYTTDSFITITGVDDLVITGETGNFSDTVILAESSDVNVLELRECSNVTIKNITMGHKTTQDCYGDVIMIGTCKDVVLENVDLFGCGVYAVSLYGESSGLKVKDSTLRDCSAGAIYIDDEFGVGRVDFTGCTLTGSNWGGWIPLSLGTEVYLTNCKLGENESNYFYFADYVVCKDCDFVEPSMYPEYGPWTPTFAVDLFKETDNNIEKLTSNIWLAYILTPKGTAISDLWAFSPYVDYRTDEALRLAFDFREDYTGSMYSHGWDNEEEFRWDIAQSGNMFMVTEDNQMHPMKFYKAVEESSELDQTWVSIELGDYLAWICLLDID